MPFVKICHLLGFCSVPALLPLLCVPSVCPWCHSVCSGVCLLSSVSSLDLWVYPVFPVLLWKSMSYVNVSSFASLVLLALILHAVFPSCLLFPDYSTVFNLCVSCCMLLVCLCFLPESLCVPLCFMYLSSPCVPVCCLILSFSQFTLFLGSVLATPSFCCMSLSTIKLIHISSACILGPYS